MLLEQKKNSDASSDDMSDSCDDVANLSVSTTASGRARKNYWTPEEDDKLKVMVEENLKHEVNWALISKNFPGRTAKQCRERWNEYLNPMFDHSPFTLDEDNIILRGQQELGNAWKDIAAQIRTKVRSSSSVKTRWHCLQRRMHEAQKRGRKRKPNPELDAFLSQVVHNRKAAEMQMQMSGGTLPPPPLRTHQLLAPIARCDQQFMLKNDDNFAYSPFVCVGTAALDTSIGMNPTSGLSSMMMPFTPNNPMANSVPVPMECVDPTSGSNNAPPLNTRNGVVITRENAESMGYFYVDKEEQKYLFALCSSSSSEA